MNDRFEISIDPSSNVQGFVWSVYDRQQSKTYRSQYTYDSVDRAIELANEAVEDIRKGTIRYSRN